MSITDEINLLNRDQFVEGVPHDWFTWLRNNAPVYHHDEPNGPGFWVVTKYDDVVTVGRDAGDVLVGSGPRRRGDDRGPAAGQE